MGERTRGRDCLQGALWSHAAYRKYLHAFATLGPDTLSCQVGTWGRLGPGLSVCESAQFMSFYLQAGGLGSKSRVVAVRRNSEPKRQQPLLPRDRWVCSLCPGPQLEA